MPILFSPVLRQCAKRREVASFLYRKFYQALNVQLIIKGMPTDAPAFWVCNHISWLDVLLLAGSHTVDFIAKVEVGKWPVIGAVVKKTGTILIPRENKFQTYRSLPKLQHRLRSGSSIIVFPEGTTTTGRSTLPFKPMLYQAAIREKAMIQPIALQYFDAEGEITEAVAFIGDDSFVNSFKRLLNQPRITAVMHFLPALSASEYHRKQLAVLNQKAINNTLILQTSKVVFTGINPTPVILATAEYYENRANSDDLIIGAKPFCYGEVIEDADPVIFKRKNDLSLDENFKGNSKKYT